MRIFPRAERFSTLLCDSVPAGIDSRVCSSVRNRTERRVMSSTTPIRFPMVHVSPTARALSLSRKIPPSRFSTVFCAPRAKAIPPMPTPASAVFVSTPSSVRTTMTATTTTNALIRRSNRSSRDRVSLCVLPGIRLRARSNETPRRRRMSHATAITRATMASRPYRSRNVSASPMERVAQRCTISERTAMTGRCSSACQWSSRRRRIGSSTRFRAMAMKAPASAENRSQGMTSDPARANHCASDAPKRCRLTSAGGIVRSTHVAVIEPCSAGTCARVSLEISQMGS